MKELAGRILHFSLMSMPDTEMKLFRTAIFIAIISSNVCLGQGAGLRQAAKDSKESFFPDLAQDHSVVIIGDFNSREEDSAEEALSDDVEPEGRALIESAPAQIQSVSPVQPTTQARSVQVTVRCAQPALVNGLELRVIHKDRDSGLFELFPGTVQFGSDGVARVELPAESYMFEVLGEKGGNLIALRAPMTAISEPSEIALNASAPAKLSLAIDNDPSAHLQQVAIRSLASWGALTWLSGSSQPTKEISLVLSPGSYYPVHIFGKNPGYGIAVWNQVAGNAGTHALRLARNVLGQTTFTWDSSHWAKPESVSISCYFPVGKLTLDLFKEPLLLTNRRSVEVSYSVGTNDAAMPFTSIEYYLPAAGQTTSIKLGGGPLKLTIPVLVVPVNKSKTLYTVGCWPELSDSSGHTLDLETRPLKSQLVFSTSAGTPIALDRRGTEQELKELVEQVTSATFSVTLSGRNVEFSAPVSRFTERKTANFVTQTPPSWVWRTECFLRKCERAFRILQQMTGKPHKRNLNIRWHQSNAFALGSPVALHLPIDGMKTSWHAYENPWALIHELLHGFAYGHGPKMSADARLVRKHLLAQRFSAADRPDYLEPVAVPNESESPRSQTRPHQEQAAGRQPKGQRKREATPVQKSQLRRAKAQEKARVRGRSAAPP